MSLGSSGSTHPSPSLPQLVSWAKGLPQPGPRPAGGKLPSRTSGWGHQSHQEQEVVCWMLRCLPDGRTWGFFLPLRPFETASALGWDGDAWPWLASGITPPQMGCSCLLWAQRELGSSSGVSSMGSSALQPRSPQPGPTPGFCLG